MERSSCHPLLRGGRRENKYSHGFSAGEIESLAGVCETILPPLPQNSLEVVGEDGQSNKAIQLFHKVSGSQYAVPDEVAELIVKWVFLEAVILARVVLTILSTRLGTLLLCGSLSFGDKWPFINTFSQISLEKREKVIQRWFKHWLLTPIRLAFVFLKFLILYVFFSQVAEAVEGLSLNFHESNEVQVNSKAFEKMNRLRMLHLNYVHLREGYEHSSRRLLWLCWKGFPLRCLPSNLHTERIDLLLTCVIVA